MAKEKTGTFFEPPVDMDLGNNPGQVKFAALSDFQIWITAEEEFWSNIHQNLHKKKVSEETKHLLEETEKKRREKMRYQPERGDIIALLRRYADGHLIHRDSKAGQLVDTFVATQDWEQAAAYIIAGSMGEIIVLAPFDQEYDIAPLIYAASKIAADLGPDNVDWQRNLKIKQNLIDQQAIQAQIATNKLNDQVKEAGTLEKQIKSLGEDLERKLDEALAPHRSSIDTTLKNAVSDGKKAKESFDSATEALTERLQIAMDKAQEEAEKRILAVDEAYRDRMDLKAVADLWMGKRRQHKTWAIIFGGAFAVGLAGVVVLTFIFGDKFIDIIGLSASIVPAAPSAGDTFDIAKRDWAPGGIVLAAAVGLAVYAFLRQLGRLFLTNLAQYGDADERIAMIDTFITLEKEGKLTAKVDRILILQALFRPGPGASPGDEGMPPHWFDMLMRRIEPGRGKGSD